MEFILKEKAQRIFDLGGSLNIPEDDEELQNYANELSCTDGFGYGLFDGGYIQPSDIIACPEQLEELNNAIALVNEFKELYEMIASEI